MDILENVLSIKKFTQFIVRAGAVIAIAAWALLPKDQVIALMAGFILFSSNVWVLTYLAGLIFNVIGGSEKETKKGTKNFALLLGLAKFSMLFICLFLLIGVLEVSGLFIFIGSLAALVLISVWLSASYLKFLSEESLRMQKEARALSSDLTADEPKKAAYDSLIPSGSIGAAGTPPATHK